MSATVAEALELLAKLAGADASFESDAGLEAIVIGLERARRHLDAAVGHALAELESRGTTDRDHGRRTGSWVSHEANLPEATGRARCRVARTLRARLGIVDDALTHGAIGLDHARVLTDAANARVIDAVAGMQDELIELAQHLSFERWAREVRAIIGLLDEDGGHDPDRDLARNRLHVTPLYDGETQLNGALVGEHALILTEAVEAEANRLFHRFARDHARCPEIEVPPRATLRALALVQLVRQGIAAGTTRTAAPATDVTLTITAGPPESGPGSKGTAPPAGAFPPGTVASHHGLPVPASATRTLLCDPAITALIVDGLGVPLDLGTGVRFFDRHQRRAIEHRDGGCFWPGCDVPFSWCDIHHVHAHERDGPTDVRNGLPACRHHHGVIHRRGWTHGITPDGWAWIRSPAGHVIWGQRHGRQREGPLPPDLR